MNRSSTRTAPGVRRADAPELIVLARRFYEFRAPSRVIARGPGALIVRRGRIVGLDRTRAARFWRGPGTRVLDLGAGVVTPGLVDAHTHLVYWALGRALVIDLSATRSLDEALTLLRRLGPRRRVGSWVLARGFDPNRWEVWPTAADLDRALPDTPLIIRSRDGHSACLNTRGLREAGIDVRTPDPPGGRYVRDTQGHPTGLVREAALERLPNPLVELCRRSDSAARRRIDSALAEAWRVAWSFGLTGVHTMDDGASLAQLARQHQEGRLGLRVVHAVPLADLERAAGLGLRSGLGDAWLRIGGIKIFSDGALGSQTAYMFDPYPQSGNGSPGRSFGTPVVAGQALREAVGRCARAGWAVWVHAIGDRAVHETIAAIGAARRLETAPLLHRIEHAQCVRPDDVRRLARLGIVASVQPCHILGDIANADRHWPRARRHAFPLRSMLEAGVCLALGSDVPVESIDPRRSLYGAVVRADERGRPAGGWFPRQRLTVAECLASFTIGAARSVGGSDPLAGTLAGGAPADLTLWLDDPLAAAPEELLELRIAGCVIDGTEHVS